MNVLVLYQRLLLCEALVTHGAAVGLLSCVDEDVDLQVVLPAEALAAEDAGERSLPRVDTLVSVQVLLGFEGLPAVAACVGTLRVQDLVMVRDGSFQTAAGGQHIFKRAALVEI